MAKKPSPPVLPTGEALKAQLAAIREELTRRAQNQLYNLFPDTGPFRRELYLKHLAAFAAGATCRERGVLGGNRCITPWTPIETSVGERRVEELIGLDGFCVRSSGGAGQASPVFLKGVEPAYRVFLDGGAWFDCSWRHRVWDGTSFAGLGQALKRVRGKYFRKRIGPGMWRHEDPQTWIDSWWTPTEREFLASLARSKDASGRLYGDALRFAKQRRVIFCPDYLVLGSERVESVLPIGLQRIYDFTVAVAHNYFAAGVLHHNTGKTTLGGYEWACHLTGWYPPWWEGKRFTRAGEYWAAGETGKKTREVPQSKLCGRIGAPTAEDGEKPDGGAPTGMGSGLIPGHLIDRWVMKPGVPDAVDMLWVRHAAGGFSHLTFKSYEMQAIGFAGDEVDGIWLDEEPDQTIYEECLLRTMTNDGIVLVTATPLLGWTPLMLDLMGRTDEQVLKEAEEERERVALGEQVVDV